MSFEGYIQALCEHGHLTNFDIYDFPIFPEFADDPVCKSCGCKIVWKNTVDQTNSGNEGIITKFKVKTPEKTDRCNLGHVHILEAATYYIPDEQETKSLREYSADNEQESDCVIEYPAHE
jgi:hypothetical protein